MYTYYINNLLFLLFISLYVKLIAVKATLKFVEKYLICLNSDIFKKTRIYLFLQINFIIQLLVHNFIARGVIKMLKF